MIMTADTLNNRQPKKPVKREDPRKLSHEDDGRTKASARPSNSSSSAKKPTTSRRPDLMECLENSIENSIKTRTIEGASRTVESIMNGMF